MRIFLLLSISLFGGGAPSLAHMHGHNLMAKAELYNKSGEQVGTVMLREKPNGVLVKLKLDKVSKGEHGFHIHEIGQCDPETGFKTAGGHWDPDHIKQARQNKEDPYVGDFPNIVVRDENTEIVKEFFKEGITLTEGHKMSVFDADGNAFILHEGPMGPRQACGVIKRVE